MTDVPTHEQLFSRNLGVFTPEQQERVRGLKVAVAGCGGLGAPCVVMLARMGVGELRLADPEVFEPCNINRQWGAYLDTIGVNKAAAIAAEVARITPYTRTLVFDEGVTAENVSGFLDGADAVVDGTEFFAFEVQALLHAAARDRGLWVYSAQGAMEIHTLFAFDPAGGGVTDALFGLSGPALIQRAIEVCFPQLPAAATPEALDDLLHGRALSIGSWSPSPSLEGALVASDLIGHLVLGRRPAAVFPDIVVHDSWALRFKLVRRRQLPDGSVIPVEDAASL
ncbi:MAG: ThiF family adenylyltransferase [Coriobacteriia bacterium]